MYYEYKLNKYGKNDDLKSAGRCKERVSDCVSSKQLDHEKRGC